MSYLEPVYFDSTLIYMQSATSLKDKGQKICDLIDALYNNALANVGNSGLEEYMLNDGQTIIKQRFQNATEIHNAITLLERALQRVYNQLNGRSVRLVDSKSFIEYRGYFGR